MAEGIAKNKAEYSQNNAIFLRGQFNDEIKSIIQTEDHIIELKDKIKNTKAQIDAQQEEFLNKYFLAIQQIYSKLGGENYRIEREFTPRGKKKVYGVKIYFMDKLIDETRFCMSESDRRALALSVFLAKIKIGNNPQSVIILDDPVTSFDQDKGLPQFFISDIMEDDIVCTIGQEDKKLLLFDDFKCWDEGVNVGTVSKVTIAQLRKSN